VAGTTFRGQYFQPARPRPTVPARDGPFGVAWTAVGHPNSSIAATETIAAMSDIPIRRSAAALGGFVIGGAVFSVAGLVPSLTIELDVSDAEAA
jgi:hypothetical protein